MSNLKSILSSFKTRQILNPKIWRKVDGEVKMDPKVRETLLEISNSFIEFLKLEIIVTDVIMTGSLANYNWSSFSDIDLHIVADFSQFPEEQLELYKELFTLKKTLYNDKHDITIFGYDVELYVQNETEAHFSSGVYSVLFDEWATKPKKEKVNIDKNLIKTKSQQWMDIIDGVIENASDEPIDIAKTLIQKYKDKLKKYRTCGLEKGGEYSDENLVFKVLRRNGYIEKLFDFENEIVDRAFSLKESKDTLGGVFTTDLQNGPSNHGKRAFGNWQSDNAWDVFAPPGTTVTSYTKGTVKKVRDTGKNSGKVFGTQVTVAGEEGFPDIFYTHLKNVRLNKGDKVDLGDVIGEISEWVGHENMTHVHIGLPRGKHLRELLRNSDKIFSGKKSKIEKTDDSQDTEKKSEDIVSSDNQTTDSKNFLESLISFAESGNTLKNQKTEGESPTYNEVVENIQKALQFLGFSLPKWGVDGKFGNETQSAIEQFQQEEKLSIDGKITPKLIEKVLLKMKDKGFKPSDLDKLQITKTETSSDKEEESPKKPSNVESSSDREYLIIKSSGYSGKNVHVLFGGSHTSSYVRNGGGAKPEAIKKYASVMEPYSNDVIIVVTHHMNTLDRVRKYVKEKFGGTVTSLAGFSQGGREAWEHASDGTLNLVGLIDPSTYKEGLTFGPNTILYCDPNNWGKSGFYGQTRNRLKWYCSNKEKYGNKVVCFNKGGTHMNFEILKSFYNRYSGKL